MTLAAPPLHRTLHAVEPRQAEDGALHYDLDLPKTVLSGQVVTEDGAPDRYPLVDIVSLDGGRDLQQIGGDAEGRFDVIGFAPGRYEVNADGFLSSNDVVQVVIGGRPTEPLRLVLKAQIRIRGRVVAGGMPVVGTDVEAVPVVGAKRVMHPPATSDAAGRFVTYLPSGTQQFDLLASPPGFALVMARVAARPDKILEVETTQNGGSIVIESAGDLGATRIRHAGADFPLGLIARMTAGRLEGDQMTLPGLEPGLYAICRNEICVSGYLAPHGVLRLALSRGAAGDDK